MSGQPGSKTFLAGIFPDLDASASGETLANLFAPPALPPLPDRLTPKLLREAIASVLERVSAYELADECVCFGLPGEAENEDSPWRGKWRYVERRIRHWTLPDLLARAVLDLGPDPGLPWEHAVAAGEYVPCAAEGGDVVVEVDLLNEHCS